MAEITLDTTLWDLYQLDGGNDEDVWLVYAVPIADIQMVKGIPPTRTFTYQSPLLPAHDKDVLAREFLQMGPQLLAFIAGNMPLILFDLDPVPEERTACNSKSSSKRRHQLDAHGVYDRLSPTQRPALKFVSEPADVLNMCTPKTKVAQVNPMDCMNILPQLVPPASHYKVLSKRTLALSGLPTPATTVVDPQLTIHGLSDNKAVATDVIRMMQLVEARKLPFVLKLPQSLSGQGTFLVRNEEERSACIEVLEPEMHRMLNQITPANIHLNPCSFLMQEMLSGEAVAISFFVTRSGKAVFNACCHQILDNEGNWEGGLVDYCAQDGLSKTYETIMNKVACYLHKNRYWGPVGADIITDDNGQQLIIDMNVRVSGSHPLGALRGFFQKRGLNVATLLFPFVVNGTRDDFGEAFSEELQEGRLVINAWIHMRDEKTSMSTITLAAEDHKELNLLTARIKKWEIVE